MNVPFILEGRALRHAVPPMAPSMKAFFETRNELVGGSKLNFDPFIAKPEGV